MFQRPNLSKVWDVSCVRRSAAPMVIDDPSGWPALLSLKLYVSRNSDLIAWTQLCTCSRLSQWELGQFKKETNTLGRINWVLETFDMKPLQIYTMCKYYTIYYTILYTIQYYTIYYTIPYTIQYYTIYFIILINNSRRKDKGNQWHDGGCISDTKFRWFT